MIPRSLLTPSGTHRVALTASAGAGAASAQPTRTTESANREPNACFTSRLLLCSRGGGCASNRRNATSGLPRDWRQPAILSVRGRDCDRRWIIQDQGLLRVGRK